MIMIANKVLVFVAVVTCYVSLRVGGLSSWPHHFMVHLRVHWAIALCLASSRCYVLLQELEMNS